MESEVRKLIKEAIEELKRGNPEDALLVLERTIDPKRGSSNWAHYDYVERMRQRAA